MEDACSQSGFYIGLFEDLREVFNLSGTTGCDYWDGNVFGNVFYKFNIKPAISTVLVNTVEENFPCTQFYLAIKTNR